MLERALDQLLAIKDFESISVGEIAETATLNRATFYAHFVDKFDLLEAMVASRFQDLLVNRGVTFDGTCASALYGVVLAVCDFLADSPYCPNQRGVAQHLERAMVGIVRNMLGEGLNMCASKGVVESDIVAAAIAGGIYAAAKQWVGSENRSSATNSAKTITKLFAPMLS